MDSVWNAYNRYLLNGNYYFYYHLFDNEMFICLIKAFLKSLSYSWWLIRLVFTKYLIDPLIDLQRSESWKDQ